MKYKGSYTVEAACLMPLLLGVIVALIYLAFFLHDRAILTETVYMAALKGSFLEESDNARIEHLVKQECNYVMEQDLIVLKEEKVSVKVNKGSIFVQLSGRMNYPTLGVLRSIGISGVIRVTAKENLQRIKPVETIRLYRVAEGVIDK